ncbi:MAG: DNA transformation protein [Rhodothermales bacterium]|jgi:DNA transformation protein
MAITPGFQAFVLEQLEQVPLVTSKSMFGGVGLYADGYFFAVLGDDRLFFKVDDSNQGDFEAAGMEPFRPYGDDRAMKYWEVPVDVLEDPEKLQVWAEKAIAVARSAKKGKKRG